MQHAENLFKNKDVYIFTLSTKSKQRRLLHKCNARFSLIFIHKDEHQYQGSHILTNATPKIPRTVPKNP